MKEEFVPYDLAIRLRRLGFDEPCFATFFSVGAWQIDCTEGALNLNYRTPCEYSILAPTFSQAFRWFRDKHHLYGRVATTSLTCHFIMIEEVTIDGTIGQNPKYKTYTSPDEAEIACLTELIEIVENI